MKVFHWYGSDVYDLFVECTWTEMYEMIQHYIDVSIAHNSSNTFNAFLESLIGTLPSLPGRYLVLPPEEQCEDYYFFFVSTKRKRVALMPRLEVVFSNLWNDEIPFGEEVQLFIDYNEYGLEKFMFAM